MHILRSVSVICVNCSSVGDSKGRASIGVEDGAAGIAECGMIEAGSVDKAVRVRITGIVSGVSSVSVPVRGGICDWAATQKGRRGGTRTYEGGGNEYSGSGADACSGGDASTTAGDVHPGGGGVGKVGAVGARGDGVADRVADDVLLAVLVGGEDDQL